MEFNLKKPVTILCRF